MTDPVTDRTNVWVGDAEPPDDFSGVWVRREVQYRAGVADGLVREWDADGRLRLEGLVEGGLWHGPLTRWRANGAVEDVSTFVHGTGTYRIFFSNGGLEQEIELVGGCRHGVTRRWNGRGELIVVEHYRDGVLVPDSDR